MLKEVQVQNTPPSSSPDLLPHRRQHNAGSRPHLLTRFSPKIPPGLLQFDPQVQIPGSGPPSSSSSSPGPLLGLLIPPSERTQREHHAQPERTQREHAGRTQRERNTERELSVNTSSESPRR